MNIKEEILVCDFCGKSISSLTVRTERCLAAYGGFHLKAFCSCGKFLKFLRHDAPKFYFGKYRFCLMEDIIQKDIDYVVWVLTEATGISSTTQIELKQLLGELRPQYLQRVNMINDTKKIQQERSK